MVVRKLFLITLFLLIPTQVWAMFVTQAKWDRRGVKEAVYSTKDGKPFYSVKSWDGVIRKRFKGTWLGTSNTIALDSKISAGKEYNLTANSKLRWFETDNLDVFEITKGELQGMAEFGAHVSAVELSTKPTKDLVFTHELEFSQGTILAYQPLELTAGEIARNHYRPPADRGAYAIFDKEGCKYAHIPRPIARDNKNYVWGTITLTYQKTEVRDGENVDVYTSTVTFKKSDLAILTAPFTLYGLDTFGYNTVGGATGGWEANKVAADGTFTPAANGTTVSIDYYTHNNVGGTLTMGLWVDNGSAYPGNLVVDTADTAQGAAAQWNAVNTDSAANVYAGTNYWIGAESSAGMSLRYDLFVSGHPLKYKTYTYVAGTCPSPFPAGATEYDIYWYSIRVTYTVGGGAAGFVIKPQIVSVVQN